MTRLVLVRHGETSWNQVRRLQGQTDVELSALGRRQAERLRDHLAPARLDAAYSSDLRRCWETATIVLAGRAVALTPTPALREIHLGEWQGLTWHEVAERDPESFARVNANPIDEQPPGGESRRQLQERIVAGVLGIVAEHPEGVVLVVSHGAALRALACWAMLADLRGSARLELDNCSISRLEIVADRPLLRGWNDVGHLGDLLDRGSGQPGVE